MNTQQIEEIYKIESELLSSGFSINEIRQQYTKFILSILNKFQNEGVSNEAREEMTLLLQDATIPETLTKGRDERKKIQAKLWCIEKENRKNNPTFSAIARCAVYGYGNKDDWEQENTGDRTPIYVMFSAIEKIAPERTGELLSFYKEMLISDHK